MYIVLPTHKGTALIPDHAISYIEASRSLVPGGAEYGILEIWFKEDDDPFVIRNTRQNVEAVFREIIEHWEERGYMVSVWFSDTDPKQLNAPAPDASATGD